MFLAQRQATHTAPASGRYLSEYTKGSLNTNNVYIEPLLLVRLLSESGAAFHEARRRSRDL